MSFTPSEDQSVAIQINAEDNASGAFAAAESSALDMKQAVAGAGAVLAGAGVAGLAGAASAAADFESAMVEVEKVTNPETAEAMSSSIREMAETIPLAQKELAGIAADAGRFGVEGPKNIEKFTESTAKMASATNLNTQQAGQAFAKLTELTGTPISEVENLGSAINELSNNTATSAQEITDSMTRSAGALSQLGMNQTEIAGMSAALNEVSESSERAGTRLRRLGQEMMNPKKTEAIASALGMTASEFETMREESPDEAMLMMAEAMAKGDENADALKNTLSTTSRQALTGLAQNLDGTRKALEMSSEAYEENTSVQKEFEAASDTFNKQLQTLRNRLSNVAIVMGNQILPVLIKAIERVTPLIDRFAEVNSKLDGMPALLATVGVALTGLGAIAVSVGPAIVGALSPVLVPVAAITAAVGLLGYAWKNNMGGIREATQQMLATVKPAIAAVERIAREVFDQYVMPMLKRLRAVWEAEFSKIMNDAMKTMDVVSDKITTVLSFLASFWNKHGQQLKTIVGGYFGAIELVTKTIMRAISATIRTILAVIRGDFDGALSIVKNFWTGTFNDILAFLKTDWFPSVKASFNAFFGFIKQLFKSIYNFLIGGSIVPKTFNEIHSFIKGFVADTKATFTKFFANLKNTFTTKLNQIRTKVTNFGTKVLNSYKRFWTDVIALFKTKFANVVRLYVGFFSTVKNKVIAGVRNITSWLRTTGKSVFKSAFGAIADVVTGVIDDMISSIKDGISGMIGWMGSKVDDAIADAAQRIEDAIPDSIDIPDIPDVGIGGGGDDDDDSGSSGSGGDEDNSYDDGGAPGGIGNPGYGTGLAQGGIVTDTTQAIIGEAGEDEAVMPLSKLSQYLDTAYKVGADTVSPSAQSGGQSSQSALTATLRVEGDGDLADLIREHAELVVEERDASKRARIARN